MSIFSRGTFVEIAANNMEKGIQGVLGAFAIESPNMGASH